MAGDVGDASPHVPRVLVVAPEPSFAQATGPALEEHGLRVTVEPDPMTATDRVAEGSVDCVLSPWRLPSMDGAELAARIRERDGGLPVIVLDADPAEETAEALGDQEATELVSGGVNAVSFGTLADRIRSAVARYRSERAQRAERDVVDRLEGQIQRTRRRITALHGVAMTLNASSSADAVYRETVDAAERVLDLDVCFAFAAEDDRFVPMAHSSQPTERELEPIPIDTGAMGETHRTGESMRAVDMDIHPLAEPTFGEYRSGISVAIGDFGVLQAVSDRPGAFDELDLELAELLAAHAASALRRLAFRTELRVERDQYAVLYENTMDCIVETEFVDGEPIVRGVNPAFEAVFGYEESEIVGQSSDGMIVPDDQSAEAERINDEAQGGEHVREEVRRLTADGPRDFLLRSVHLTADRAYAVYTDIDERKRYERELARKNDRLERFSRVVSHDLRNPLNVAEGNLQIARSEGDWDRLDAVESALDRMGDLVDETLALARHGRTIRETEPVDLAALVDECWATVDTRGASLRVEDPPTIVADPPRLRNVFENLFRNAAEHAGTGATIRVGALPDGFFVEDDGPGVPAEERDRAFDVGVSTTAEGNGFGLAIVQSIVDAHGWDVEVVEGRDGGARFEVTGVELDG